MSRFIVMDRSARRVRYQAESLEQAKGFVDASGRPSAIFVNCSPRYSAPVVMQPCIVDSDSGTVLARGPECDIDELAAATFALRLVWLPVAKEGGAE